MSEQDEELETFREEYMKRLRTWFRARAQEIVDRTLTEMLNEIPPPPVVEEAPPLPRKLQFSREARQRLIGKVVDLERKLKESDKALVKRIEEVTNFERRLKNSRDTGEMLSTKLREREGENHQLRLRNSALKAKLKESEDGGESLRSELLTEQDLIRSLRKSLDGCVKTSHGIEAKLSAEKADVTMLKGRLAAAETEAAQANRENHERYCEIQTLRGDLEAATRRGDALEVELGGAKVDGTVQDARLGEEKERNERLRVELDEANATISRLQEEVDDANGCIDRYSRMLAQAGERLARLEDDGK